MPYITHTLAPQDLNNVNTCAPRLVVIQLKVELGKAAVYEAQCTWRNFWEKLLQKKNKLEIGKLSKNIQL